MSNKKATPLDIMRAARDSARAGLVKGVPSAKSVALKGRYGAPTASPKGYRATTPAAYAQSMIAGMGASMRQEYVGGPYVGPFRYRPNRMGSYARRDED